MLTFLNLFISSFSQLLSSPSFALMANKSVLDALNHCVTPSLSFDSQENIQPASAGITDETHMRRVELEPLLRASLLKSSSPSHITISRSAHLAFISTPLVPANSPSLTPSNSFPDFSLRGDSPCPSSSPSSSSVAPLLDLSLTSDSDSSDYPDEDPEGPRLSDSPSILSNHAILTRGNVPSGVGLGITGIRKHNGGGEFDGIGLLSIHRGTLKPACVPHEANTRLNPFQLSESFTQHSSDEAKLELSDTFLREAEMTFIQDPFHKHSLATIPECCSWSDLDSGCRETYDPLSVGILDDFAISHASPASDNGSTLDKVAPLRRLKKHFSASTISSELKRTSVSTAIRHMSLSSGRERSSTWPSRARSRLDSARSKLPKNTV